MKKVHQMLRDFRESRGVTQTHIAKQSGLTGSRISQIETGLVRLTADEFLKIVIEGFGTTPQIFFDEQLSKNEKEDAEQPND